MKEGTQRGKWNEIGSEKEGMRRGKGREEMVEEKGGENKKEVGGKEQNMEESRGR